MNWKFIVLIGIVIIVLSIILLIVIKRFKGRKIDYSKEIYVVDHKDAVPKMRVCFLVATHVNGIVKVFSPYYMKKLTAKYDNDHLNLHINYGKDLDSKISRSK